jgi:outer membrane protein TolC
MHYYRLKIFLVLAIIYSGSLKAQVRTMSAREAVQFAVANSPTVKNAILDTEIAKARVMETTSAGLPQVTGSAVLQYYPEVQRFVLENTPNTPFYTTALPADAPVAFGLQLANSFSGTVSATQLIFNGSYLVGLKASKTYQELSAKQLKQARISLAEQVLKSYYAILVNQEKTRLLDLNLARLDSTFRETQALHKNGFIEKVDLDRIEVALNNLKSEKQKTNRLLQLSNHGLKFLMGMPIKDSLALSGKLDEVNPDSLAPVSGPVDYNQRIEYSTLQTQKALAALDLKNVQSGYLPSLVGLATLGVNSAASKFRNLGNFSEKNRYAPYGFVGLSLNIPVFDGFQKKYKAQQARINLRKLNNGFNQLESAIDLEVQQANTNLANAFTNYEIQKRNLSLAQEVVRVSKVKYRQGVGSNLEVTNAESSLKESQTNYYSALYDFIIAKIDLDKAQGKLLND